MLILTRRIGETLVIGDETRVTVLNVHGNQVRLGIAAPQHISVHREEIQRRIDAERNQSGHKAINDDVKKAVGGSTRPTLSRTAV